MSDAARRRLCRALGHAFRDPGLLDAALTHRSASGSNNERLEFLGDALLNCLVGEALYRALPRASEGHLSRLRASLVKEQALAELAQELELGEVLVLGPGEMKSGGYRRASILADALEAVIGAVYLDSDFPTARELVLRLYAGRLQRLPSEEELKDPKTRLQEWLQARARALPVYEVREVSGEPPEQIFTVECHVDGQITIAAGGSRRKAEQEAARRALEQLQDES